MPHPDNLATLLLTAVKQASYALQRLEQFAANYADADPAALINIADAITTMTHPRTRLIRDADSIDTPD